jgi:hypothetical protein
MARARSSPNNSTANLGFEATLWLAAEKPRSNKDAGEYKHVLLGLDLALRGIEADFGAEHAETFRDDHHELVAEATRIVQEERRDTQAGQLGNRRGARYRTYERLQDYIRHREGDIFLTDQVRAAIQAIYDHPLTTEAVDKLNRQLRSSSSDDDLAQLVTTLQGDDRLVLANFHDTELKQLHIVCSMGLADQQA